MRTTLTTAALLIAVAAQAQQPMGTVATHDALVTGGLEVHAERASLVSNASITAYDRTATIDLTRGGQVLVCATSQFHLLRSGPGPSLLFALDRGAFELRTASQPQDVILTPDLRFTLASPGALDLSLRVTPNGDTCVDNTGSNAPTLQVADVFTDATYRLTPGQHVLFEHGSLKEVVDRETSACGCPIEAVPNIATTPGQPTTPALAEAQHPFPAAVSQGLAAPPLVDNSNPAGEKHTQVSAILNYGTNQPDSTSLPAPGPGVATPSPQATPPTTVSAQPPPSPPGAHDIFHAIGHFFHKLFHSAN